MAHGRAIAIGVAIADALAHAHRHGVVHRDVKPANIFIERAPTLVAKLADFDLARDATRSGGTTGATRLTGTSEVVGTPSYLAPEQLTRSRQVDGRADVYGLAAVLYHCVSGKAPFEGMPDTDYLCDLGGKGPPPLDEIAPRVPVAVRRAIELGMTVSLAKRPDAAAFARVLRAVVESR